METIEILEKNKCTGCGMCVSICPQNAIYMESDDEGFLFPIVNYEKCNRCGLCAKKCPQLSKKHLFNDNIKCFAVQIEQSYRSKGSSGGVFPAIASQVVKKDKARVVGAAFDDSQMNLSHIIVEDKNDLEKLYKSKYLQSNMLGIYEKMQKELDNNKMVVFSGCPCQVDAVKTFFGNKYSNLYTIDILCHGVPSPKAYKIYANEIAGEDKKIKKFDFRDKKYGWGTLISIDVGDQIIYQDWKSEYFRAFLSGLNMRKCCYQCPYATKNRVGDITLGDFWGIEKYHAEFNDRLGTSLVMCNTTKGRELFDKIKRKTSKTKEISLSETIEISKKHNGALLNPTPLHKMRKCFFYHLNKDGFLKAYRYAIKAIMDVGIVGWWIETPRSNYGSTLTAYALGQYLDSLGLSVAYISPPNFDRNGAGEFNKKYEYRMTAKYPQSQMSENNKYFDSYIVGSDVLWYYDAFIKTGYMFMLDFADSNVKKISYATSFGNTKRFFPEKEMLLAGHYLKKFDHLSVRELEGVDILKNKFNLEGEQVLDPVFLCPKSSWNLLENNSEIKTEGDFVFAYLLDPTIEHAKNLSKLAKKLNSKLVIIIDKQYNPEQKMEMLKSYNVIYPASIETFIYHIKNAKLVVTDSFHGTCFSLIFKRDFISIINRNRGASRFDTISKLFDIEQHFAENTENLANRKNLNVDYSIVQKKIDFHIERSKKWLNNAVLTDKKPTSYDDRLVDFMFSLKEQVQELEKQMQVVMDHLKLNKDK